MDETLTTPLAPGFAVAGSFLEALAGRDFDRLGRALDPAATMSALLPRGFDTWDGPDAIVAAFERWFGDVDAFEVLDAAVGQVGGRLQLRWRVRVEGGPRFPDGARVLEQNVFADTAANGRIVFLALLCSGFCETADQ